MRFGTTLFTLFAFAAVFGLSTTVAFTQDGVGKTTQQSEAGSERGRDCDDRRNDKAGKVVQEALWAFQLQDIDTLENLVDDRIVVEIPLTTTGSTNPGRFEGKNAAVGHFRGLFDLFRQINFTHINTIIAEDGSTVFVEAQGDFLTRTIDYRYQNVYLLKFQVRHGKIVRFTEYNNPIIILNLERALGQQ